MTPKNKVNIRIAGSDYTLVGVESDEYMQKVGLYIDRKMNEIIKANSRLSTSMAAVLTSINVADDYFKAHEKEVNSEYELKRYKAELESLKEENKRLSQDNADINNKISAIHMDLIKREAELSSIKAEFESLKAENSRLSQENADINNKLSTVQMELTKKETELNETRSSLRKVVKPVHGKNY